MTRLVAWLRGGWRWVKAAFRLDLDAVCELAAQGYDYRDYPDDKLGFPEHMIPLTCKRCGKEFYI